MSEVDIIAPETQKLILKSEEEASQLSTFVITNNEQYINAADKLRTVKTAIDRLDGLRKSLTSPLDMSKKRIMDIFRKPIEAWQAAEINIKRGMLTFQQEQEKIRREEESRLSELQRKEAERLARRAEKAEANGNTEKAEALKEKAQNAQLFTPVVESKVEKISGISKKIIWKYRVTNIDLIDRKYLIPNEKLLGDVARATKGTLKEAGIEFYPEEIIASRM